jgi:nickel/cobalt exporter
VRAMAVAGVLSLTMSARPSCFFALSRGAPEAGLTFAVAMMIGVGLTLCSVAVVTTLARDWLVRLLASHGATMERLAGLLDGLAGVSLIAIAGWALLR